MSSAYHPQSDGQTEVVNKSLEHYLRSFSSDRPTEWDEWLYLAEYQFNTNYHTTTKMTLYEALYGFSPPQLVDYVPSTTQVATVDSILHSRQQLLTLLKQNLVVAQARMKQQSDLHRIERVFNVGDWVYLRLDLPVESAIHPVFYVSCLKARLGNHNISIPMLPFINSQGILTLEPVVVLQTRSHQLQRRTITQLLIQWQGGSLEDATWEDLFLLQQQFPHLVGKMF